MTAPTVGRTWRCWATVGWHQDGDTWVADQLDLGFGVILRPVSRREPGHCAIRVLYPGGGAFDAPETKGASRDRGLEAADFAAGLLPIGREVAIESYGFDSFGRTLASVLLPDGWDLAMRMAAAGYDVNDPRAVGR